MAETCPIGTRARLEALLGGGLPAEERSALQAHLADPCETCLQLLEAMDDEAMLLAAAGPGAELSAEEAEQMFEAVAPPAPVTAPTSETAPGLIQRIASWLRPPVLVPLAAAAVLVVAFGLSTMTGDEGATEKARYTGEKGVAAAATARPELLGFVGTYQNGTPQVVRRLGTDETLAAGELLLLRYRLVQPAFVYLLVEADDEASLLHAGEARSPAGEHELSSEGQVLAVDPAQLGRSAQLVLIASPERLADPDPAALLDAGLRSASCPGCTAATLQVRAEPAR